MKELDPGAGLSSRSILLEDGRRLRVVEAGRGEPLVVFEAGGGACASEWIAVQRQVAVHTRTLAYDRAGYGGSDADPRPRTLQNMARDLVGLLDALGHHDPVVLAAHSWGGPIARSFAQAAPDRVAGLVLIDATVSALMTARDAKLASRMAAVQVGMSTLRLPNPLIRMLRGTFGPDFPDADRDLMVRDFVDAHGIVAFRREAAEIAGELSTLHDLETAGLPAVPVASVIGGTAARGQAQLRAKLRDHQAEEMERVGGTLTVVDGAGHYVPQQRPTEAARAVVELVDRVREERARAES